MCSRGISLLNSKLFYGDITMTNNLKRGVLALLLARAADLPARAVDSPPVKVIVDVPHYTQALPPVVDSEPGVPLTPAQVPQGQGLPGRADSPLSFGLLTNNGLIHVEVPS